MNKVFIQKITKRIERYFGETSSHGFDHTQRVCNMAMHLAEDEDVDLDIIQVSALLHDIARHKESLGEVVCHADEGARMAEGILREVGFPVEKISQVVYAIRVHRYGKRITPDTLEASILQDADRLDALGAICIARVFSFSVKMNRPMYDLSIPPNPNYDGKSIRSQTAINHFYEKILKIKPETFKTKKAQEIARGRYQAIVDFVERFKKEWVGEI